MGMNNDDAANLVEQLQHAHRIAVAFYKRILPTFDDMATNLACEFWYWQPTETSRPSRSIAQPSRSWAWDYIPLFASDHVYWRTAKGKPAKSEDIILEFRLYVDDEFSSTNRKKNKIIDEPDPISLPIGAGILQIEIYRPVGTPKLSFDQIWEDSEEMEGSMGQGPMGQIKYIDSNGQQSLEGFRFEWQLTEILVDQEPILRKLKEHIK